jgi:aminopeptidase
MLMFDVEKLARLATEYCISVSDGNKIRIDGNVVATPLIEHLYKHILLKGGHPLPNLRLGEFDELLFTYGSEKQIEFVSSSDKVLFNEVDALIEILAESNTKRLSRIDPVKLKMRITSRREITDILVKRLLKTGTYLVLPYPTQAFAQDAEMGLLEYEDFVTKACFLDKKNPVKEWRQISMMQDKVIKALKKAKNLRFVGEDTDLSLCVEGRTWINCDGHGNMPDGEIFTCPIESSAQGQIRFTYPGIYARIGREVEDIVLNFKNGRVVEFKSEKGEDVLREILKTDEGARRIGEIAFGTNMGITKFTKNMLFDEKMGHCIHLALGFSPDPKETGGKNQSSIHWDLLKDMRTGEIYADDEIVYEKGKLLI